MVIPVEKMGRNRHCEPNAGPSTAPLAMKLREAALRMTLLLFRICPETKVCVDFSDVSDQNKQGQRQKRISPLRCGMTDRRTGDSLSLLVERFERYGWVKGFGVLHFAQ